MQHCALILADLYPESPADPAAWPRLPELEYWLSRADAAPLGAHDWREWLARRAGGAELAGVALAGVAAAALTVVASDAAGAHYWLATPVHWVAGLDTVRLHPAGLLTLTVSEQQQLASDFARVFVGSGWQLLATDARELLVSGAPLADTLSDDPARWLGKSPKSGMPRGAGAPTLRRLGAEIEMWLHEHAINRARAAAGQVTVSGLWLWGGGALTAVAAASHDALYADDLYARSLWQLGGSSASALPAGWAGLHAAAESPAAAVVVVPVGDGGAGIERLERDWIRPAMLDWRAGRVAAMTLIAGATQWTLSRAARWRVWRRARPWWESLTC